MPVASPLSVEEVIALVREARARTFTCEGCGRETRVLIPATTFSRLPVMCEECEPKSQTWARERAERPLRAAILYLDAELTAARGLISQVVGDADLVRRSRRFGNPGKATLGRAIRLVAAARGRTATADALWDLAAVALDWARFLAAPSPLSITEALDPELREAG